MYLYICLLRVSDKSRHRKLPCFAKIVKVVIFQSMSIYEIFNTLRVGSDWDLFVFHKYPRVHNTKLYNIYSKEVCTNRTRRYEMFRSVNTSFLRVRVFLKFNTSQLLNRLHTKEAYCFFFHDLNRTHLMSEPTSDYVLELCRLFHLYVFDKSKVICEMSLINLKLLI